MLTASYKLVNWLKQIEGLRLEAYLCPAGKWTCGFGHTGPDVKKGTTCSLKQALSWLTADIKVAEYRIDTTLITGRFTQGQWDALVGFVFNTGHIGQHLAQALDSENQGEIIKWWKTYIHDDHGNVIPGLVNRRQKEIEEFWKKP